MSKAPIASHLLQSASASGNGNVVDLKGLGQHHTAYIEGSAGVSAGAVQLETADDPDYTGTWAPIGAPETVVVNATTIAQFTGAFRAIRARISTNIVGGTTTVKLVSTE